MFLSIYWDEAIETISQILSAGVAITAFSLLLYAFAFNLRENVARAFILILTNVVIVFTTHSIATVGANETLVELMLKLKWVGIFSCLQPIFIFQIHCLPNGTPQPWQALLAGAIDLSVLVFPGSDDPLKYSNWDLHPRGFSRTLSDA